MSFYNTELYLEPEETSKKAVPSGYTNVHKLPLQIDKSIPGVDLQNLNAFVVFTFILQQFLGFAQAKLFGMIKNLQITVHLALFYVPFTENTWEIFRVLLTCVKYDFLEPILEQIPFGFSTTRPWNNRFA